MVARKDDADWNTAITHHTGYLQILACAGSGKTEIISTRIAELICRRRVPPRTIVAFTFTNKAAEELKGRIRLRIDDITKEEKLSEVADLGDMFVGTIDSFCFHMLKELKPEYKGFDILQEAARIAFISRFYGEIGLKLLESESAGRYRVTAAFANDVDLVRREKLGPDQLGNKEFLACSKKYFDILKREKFMDFEGVISTLLLELCNPEVRKDMHSRIKHLTVDEYQDVNRSQEELVEVLSIGCDSVCVVGDDDQCIYYWRGSEVKNIVDFEKKYGKKYSVTTVRREINFRSTVGIIHTAKCFISLNKHRQPKEMKHSATSENTFDQGDLYYRHFDKEEDEFDYIVSTIKNLNGADYTEKDGKKFSLAYRDMTILVRKNKDAARLVKYLDEHGIKVLTEEGGSAFDSPEVMLALKSICHLAGFDYYRYKPFGQSIREKVTRSDLASLYSSVFPPTSYREANSKLYLVALDGLKSRVSKIASKQKDYLPDQFTFQNIFHLVLCAMGAERFDFNKPHYERIMYNFSVLSQAISDFESVYRRLRVKELSGFLHFIATYGEVKYKESSHNDPSALNCVRILTIHKAKGLQFPVVFMPCSITTRGGQPNLSFIDPSEYDRAKYEGTEEDERRVWYVGMTRAQKYLFFTGSSLRIGYKQKTKPHGFIEKLDRKYISQEAPRITKTGRPERPIHYSELYPTSFSEISSYQRCPYDFKFRHVFGLNAGVPSAFGYGTNVHNVLNIIYKKFHDRPPTEKEIDVMVEKYFHFRYATPEITKNMKKAGKAVISNYVNLFSADFRHVLETEKKFEFVVENASISGQIDLIKKLDDANNLIGVEIIDFKTDSDGPYERDYATQLRLYAIACMESLGLNPKKAVVHHLDRKTKRDVEEEISITASDLNTTKKKLVMGVQEIQSGQFPGRPKDMLCTKCDYRFVCNRKCVKVKP